jgi:transposase
MAKSHIGRGISDESARQLAQMRDGAARGMSMNEIAKEFGISYGKVYDLAATYNIATARKPRAARLYNDLENLIGAKCWLGWPATRIAEFYGVSVDYVLQIARSRGIEHRIADAD